MRSEVSMFRTMSMDPDENLWGSGVCSGMVQTIIFHSVRKGEDIKPLSLRKPRKSFVFLASANAG
jgi:hypothetical protein